MKGHEDGSGMTCHEAVIVTLAGDDNGLGQGGMEEVERSV